MLQGRLGRSAPPGTQRAGRVCTQPGDSACCACVGTRLCMQSKGLATGRPARMGPPLVSSSRRHPSSHASTPSPPALPASRPIASDPRTIPPLTSPHPAHPPTPATRWSGCSGACATPGPATSRAWTCCGRPRSAACTPSRRSCWAWVSGGCLHLRQGLPVIVARACGLAHPIAAAHNMHVTSCLALLAPSCLALARPMEARRGNKISDAMVDVKAAGTAPWPVHHITSHYPPWLLLSSLRRNRRRNHRRHGGHEGGGGGHPHLWTVPAAHAAPPARGGVCDAREV